MLNIFSWTSSGHLLWKNVYLGLPSIFWLGCLFLLLSCMSYLYILEINPCWSHHLQIFPPILQVVFVLCMVSFAAPKLISLVKSHLFIFAFISIALGDWPKKSLAQFISGSVSSWGLVRNFHFQLSQQLRWGVSFSGTASCVFHAPHDCEMSNGRCIPFIIISS